MPRLGLQGCGASLDGAAETMLRTVIESPDDPRLSNRRPHRLAPVLTQHPLLTGATIALFVVAWIRILPLVIFTVRQDLGFADFIEMSFSSSNTSLFAFDFVLYFAPVWMFALWFRGNSSRFATDVSRALTAPEPVPEPNASASARLVFVAAGAIAMTGLQVLLSWHFELAVIDQALYGWLPLLAAAVTYVALSDAIFGALVVTGWLTQQTEFFDLDVIPLHPDQAGGFSFIGKMLIAIAALLISIGLALVLGSLINLAFVTVSEGDFASIPLEAFVSYYLAYGVLYVAAVYLLLWRPTQAVRSAMLRPRDRILFEIAKELQRLEASVPSVISARDEGSRQLSKINGEVRRLRNLSEAVQATYPGWPMSVRWTRGLQITALTPLLAGLASVVLKFIEGD